MRNMGLKIALVVSVYVLTSADLVRATDYRIAVFSADITVPIGHPMMGGAWRAKRVEDSLEARGFVILGTRRPIVYVALDWCEVRGAAYEAWQSALAKSAGTDPECVIISAIHQHDTPVADLEAEQILRSRGLAGSVCDPEFHAVAVERCARALEASLRSPARFTHVGFGQAEVKEIASNRRYVANDGSVRFNRMSRSVDSATREADEGLIDPWLKRISFWDGDKEVAAVSVYAVHPMSYYGQGDISADFPGLARRQHQADKPGTMQIYATGCAGNVTAGKYNAGMPADRLALANRLAAAMKLADQKTIRYPLQEIKFQNEPLELKPRSGVGFSPDELVEKLRVQKDSFRQCLAAMGLAWRNRCDAGKKISVPAIHFGPVHWIVLPGEAYVEYQLAAQRMSPESFVVVSGYGEAGTGYIPTDRHWRENDSNLADWCWVEPGAEKGVLSVIRKLLQADDQAPPWYRNTPIAYVKKQLYVAHTKPGSAALVSMFRSGPEQERMEIRANEERSDVPADPKVRFSSDEGKTWSAFAPLPATLQFPKGIEVWEGGWSKLFDPGTGRLVETWLRQIERGGQFHCFTYCRTSRDGGRTWSKPTPLRYEAGDDFDPSDPLKKSFLDRNQAYMGNNIIRLQDGTLVTAVAHANAANDPENNKRPWRMGAYLFRGVWDRNREDYTWSASKPIEIKPTVSSRGLMEPAVVELSDGRLLIVWRTSSTKETPGQKWFSVSADGGRSMTDPEPWKYAEGSSFYSPSSIHYFYRQSTTNKLYWLGNIAAEPPQGNMPRYPLVMAEVDEGKAALRKETVTAIDSRMPGQSSEIQFSNFAFLENKTTGELELWMTLYSEDATNVFSADNYRYSIWLR